MCLVTMPWNERLYEATVLRLGFFATCVFYLEMMDSYIKRPSVTIGETLSLLIIITIILQVLLSFKPR
jgi:hypothetical protein